MDPTAKLSRLVESYLDHIRIAVEAGDKAAPFRDFLDNWAAFSSDTDHHRSAEYGVKWFNNPDANTQREMLLSLPFRSTGAAAILQYALERPHEYIERRKAKDKAVRLMVDHAVPLRVMVNWFFEKGADLSRDGISNLLRRWYFLGLLTHAEDKKLNELGLRSQMPAHWDGENVIARYQYANISSGFVQTSG